MAKDKNISKKNNYIFQILKVFISLSLICYLLSKNPLSEILIEIKHLKTTYFIYAFFISSFLIPLIAAFRWYLLLSPGDINLGYRDILKLTYTGFFFNLVLPGSVGGDTVKGVIFYRLTKSSSLSASSILFDRFIGLLALAFLSLVSSIVYYKISFNSSFALEAVVFLAILLLFIFLVFLPAVQKKLLLLMARMKLKRLENFLKQSLGIMNWFKSHPAILVLTFLISIITHSLAVVTCYMIGIALSLHISIGYYFLFFPLIALIMSLPVSISGLGVRESSFAYFFSGIGVPEVTSISLSLLFFSQGMICGLLGGIIYLCSSFSEPENGETKNVIITPEEVTG